MKKITIDARMINASGIGTVIKNVIKRLVFVKKEWIFYILGNINELKQYEYLNRKNVILIECNAPIYTIKEQFALIKAIPSDTDIMWSPHYNIPIFYKGKLVVTIHDVFHLAMINFVHGIHKKIYAKFMFNMVKIKANKIVTDSNFTKRELKRYIKVKSEKLSIIYIGIDKNWFNIKSDIKPYDRPYILYVGNVKPHKNLKTLITVYNELRNKIKYDLIIVGKKDGFITNDNVVKNLVKQDDNRIVFTGYVNDELLKQYYKHADIFVFPSLYEGFGLPPLEALAAGTKRVICSNAGALPEICGDMVEYFSPLDNEELKSLLLNNNNYAKSNKTLKRYDWDITVQKYIEVLLDV